MARKTFADKYMELLDKLSLVADYCKALRKK